MQSRFDAWQLPHEVSSAFSVAQANEYGERLVQALRESLFCEDNPPHGAFVDSCYRHGQSAACGGRENYWSGDVMRAREGAAGRRYTVQEAVAVWLSGVTHPPYHRSRDMYFHEQQQQGFPCRECCPACPVLVDGKWQK